MSVAVRRIPPTGPGTVLAATQAFFMSLCCFYIGSLFLLPNISSWSYSWSKDAGLVSVPLCLSQNNRLWHCAVHSVNASGKYVIGDLISFRRIIGVFFSGDLKARSLPKSCLIPRLIKIQHEFNAYWYVLGGSDSALVSISTLWPKGCNPPPLHMMAFMCFQWKDVLIWHHTKTL